MFKIVICTYSRLDSVVYAISGSLGSPGLANYSAHSDELPERYRRTYEARAFGGPDFAAEEPIDKMGFDMEWRHVLKEFSDINRFRISSEAMDSGSLEDRVRLLYSVNSCDLARWNPHGWQDPVVSFVNLSLDSPVMSNEIPHEELLDRRSRSPFESGVWDRALLPEEFSELRRVADRLSTFQRVVDYDYFNIAARTPITSILHHRVPSDSFVSTNLTVLPRAQSAMRDQRMALDDYRLFVDQFPWYYRPYFFAVGLVGKVVGTINNYIGPFTGQGPDLFGRDRWIAGSVFDPRSPMYTVSADFGKSPAASGCGTSSAFTPKKEDPSQYFGDVNIYLQSLSSMYTYSSQLHSRVLSVYFGLSPYFDFLPVELSYQTPFLFLVIFSGVLVFIVVVAAFASTRFDSILVVAVVFEAMSLCLVVLWCAAGCIWFDPISTIVSIVVIVVSSTELAVALGVFVVFYKVFNR